MSKFHSWNISCIPPVIYSVTTGNIVEQVRRSLIIDIDYWYYQNTVTETISVDKKAHFPLTEIVDFGHFDSHSLYFISNTFKFLLQPLTILFKSYQSQIKFKIFFFKIREIVTSLLCQHPKMFLSDLIYCGSTNILHESLKSNSQIWDNFWQLKAL